MLKSIILILLLGINLAFAQGRFKVEDRKKFIDEVKLGIAEHKLENGGKVNFSMIKEDLYEDIEEFFDAEEMKKVTAEYEAFIKNPKNTEDDFYRFMERQYDDLNKKPIIIVKEGEVCKKDNCAKGLVCATDPKSPAGKEVNRCFKPLTLGQSCATNPVCGEGQCLFYDSETSGIGECLALNNQCKKNSDCCSNSCSNGKCQANLVCKSCVGHGQKITDSKKCCEGLYKNEKGICMPDVPPMVMPEVNYTPKSNSILQTFVNFFISTASAQNANSEMWNTVNRNRKKYANFQGESSPDDKMKNTPPALKFTRSSNFDTCEINFKHDFYNYLSRESSPTSGAKLIDLEIALLGFDFVLSGDGSNDYWTSSINSQNTSLYSRLKEVTVNNRKIRKATNEKIAAINDKMTCMCLDVRGYKNIENADKKKFFEEKCEEYAKYQDPSTTFDELEGDASGIKGKRLIVYWTQTLSDFNQTLTVDNTQAFRTIAEVHRWSTNDARWGQAEHKVYNLFKFNIRDKYDTVAAAYGAVVGALLAAGVIAIIGGFATTSIISAWGAAGIIAASAVTGGSGAWLVASLKGAWISKHPEIQDDYIRTFKCGKKKKCNEYRRELHQPFNNVCNVHTSANACIKDFMVFEKDLSTRYLVDPWVPNGVSKSLLLKDSLTGKNYAQKLEDGFQAAKSRMLSKNPGGRVGGEYRVNLFIDAGVLASYTPKLGTDLETKYIINSDLQKTIKEAAQKFAIAEGVLDEQDKENLKNFGEYAYNFHFLWPKTSKANEISYPTTGFITYLDYMSNGVAASLAVGAKRARDSFGGLGERYLTDYLQTLNLYSQQAVNQTDAIKKTLLNKEIAKVTSDLQTLRILNEASANSNLNSQLTSSSFKSPTTGETANFTSGQQSFLNSVRTLRNARKEQLKKLDAFNKAIASSGNPERAENVKNASKRFLASFAKPSSGTIIPGKLTAPATSSSSKASSEDSESTKVASNDYNYATSGNGSLFGAGKISSSSPSAVVAPPAKAEEVVDADAERLADAIAARDRLNKDKYKSNDGQSLFEKVTNAYIRNYDKVLTKKKDKDVIEEQKE